MKTLIEPNERSYAINMKKSPDPQARYRLSGFAVPFAENGVFLMKNILTGETVRLSEKEFEAALYLKDHDEGAGYIEINDLTELVIHCFIVESDYDEAERYMTTVKLIRLMQPDKPGLKTYTILPTTACNARCTYCYEEGYAVRTMTRETVERLIDFICETRRHETITLSWFGGEPLVCADTISYVCRELENRGVPFKSKMITNASLMTKALAREAKEVWKLDKIQVSLDGDRRDYTERKRYADPEIYNYETVMRAIRSLAEEDIKVELRINFDRDSFCRLRPFLDEMKVKFGAYNNVTLYLSALYQEKHKPYFIELERQMFALTRCIDELGLGNVEREKHITAFRLNSCMADCLEKTIVIDPEGKFFNCEHLPERNTWGNIFDGITDQKRFEELSAPYDPDEKCAKCAFLPQCTPFYKHGCPEWFAACQEFQYLKTEYELRKLAENEPKTE